MDHDVSLHVALLLRQLGHRATTARDLGLERAGDDEHLFIAAQRAWILVTHNRQHFCLLHDAWRHWLPAWGVPVMHAGILIPPQGLPDHTIQLLQEFFASGLSLLNELYVWRLASGWTRRL